MTAPTPPDTAARKQASASKTDDPKMSMFHVNGQADQAVIENRIATWSRASSKSWRTRKRMAEARSRAEYQSAADEHARLLAAEEGKR
jgi:hypothetical protein